MREVLNSERFQDLAPREVYAELLDEGRYLCSMQHHVPDPGAHAEVRERRNQLRHPVYQKPELLATGPNQVWSWDITQLRGPSKGVYYYLYVMIDIFSRYVVGWMIAEVESADLAGQLIAETCAKQNVQRATVDASCRQRQPDDRQVGSRVAGGSRRGQSHSRPHVSDDNPFSEAQFKTLKYRPDYPDRFGRWPMPAAGHAASFAWYNDRHHHSGLGLLTPADVHHGRAETVRRKRQEALLRAYQAHPERFVRGAPAPDRLPEAVWINPPNRRNCCAALSKGIHAPRCVRSSCKLGVSAPGNNSSSSSRGEKARPTHGTDPVTTGPASAPDYAA